MAKLSTNISKIKLKDIMKTDLIKINPESSAGDAAKLMLKNKIHGLPVVKKDNEEDILNVVTSFDLLGLTYYGRFSEEADFINTTKISKLTEEQQLLSLPPDASVKQAMDIIAEKGIRTIPIVENDKLVGIISVIDIIRAILSTGKPAQE